MSDAAGCYFGIDAQGRVNSACWFGRPPRHPSEQEARNFVRRGNKSTRKLRQDDPGFQDMLDAFMKRATEAAQ